MRESANEEFKNKESNARCHAKMQKMRSECGYHKEKGKSE
jgi:hypothetical protein